MEQLHQPGDVILSRYRVIDTLGQGGSGTTYLVEDINTHQQIALKALSLQRLSDWKSIQLFEREARILASLNYASIPQYLDYFQTDTASDRCFYIAQQLAPGKSLAALVESGWHADFSIVKSIAISVLEILVYLHSQSPPVIHRDIKPQNIIRGDDGQVYLVDFGAVQEAYHNTFMRGSTVVGTYGYMAPEQFRGQAVPTTDLYGLGATLLFLLTHRSPADLPTDRLKIDFRSRVQVPEEFADFLEKMLEPDVEDRFSSASEALAVLRGKRIIRAKSSNSVNWKALVAVGVATVAAGSVINAHKYSILNNLGIKPDLCLAIESGDIDMLRNYLNQGGNPNTQFKIFSRWGDNPILLTCATERQDAVALLIAKGADVNAKSNSGYTPLMAAVGRGNFNMVALLIAKGADVNAKNIDGDTLLFQAVRSRHFDVAALLIANGADINAKNNYGETPLLEAVKSYEFDVVKKANFDVVALLIAKGADVNATTDHGETPLFEAVKSRNFDVVALLIAKGAEVNAKNNYGETPLESASKFAPAPDIVEYFKAHGAR